MGRAILCFSHVRWDFVLERSNHLMERAARRGPVLYVQEPSVRDDEPLPRMEVHPVEAALWVVQPILPASLPRAEQDAVLAVLIGRLVRERGIVAPILWYDTPMALPWTQHLAAHAVVYDCADPLSAFKGAPREIAELERQLLARADLVFAAGRRLQQEKRRLNPRVHLFPSSIDREHFAAARRPGPEPDDQTGIPHPRLGYFGVIDDRIDLELLAALAERRPAWQLVLVGPVATIDRGDLPAGPNVHVLGMKAYAELPAYLRGWDVAIMPFARSEAARFISPTTAPEYLAGGRAVVATPIDDVVEPYGREGLARIAGDRDAFGRAVEEALVAGPPDQARVDAVLARTSWDRTWDAMADLLDALEPTPAAVAVASGGRRRLPRIGASGRTAATPAGLVSDATR